MFVKSSTLICAALATVCFAPVQAAIVTDSSAEVVLFSGDIFAESYAPASDLSGFDPVYAMLAGGASGFDPAFIFLLDDSDGEALYGETDTYSFNGSDTLNFTFDVTGSGVAAFGPTILVEFLFADAIADPFAATADIFATAIMNISGVSVAPVPLPAGLPLLASGLLGAAALRRRKG